MEMEVEVRGGVSEGERERDVEIGTHTHTHTGTYWRLHKSFAQQSPVEVSEPRVALHCAQRVE